MSAPFPFDAVLFDLDGTLLATERFWVAAARVGAKRAFAELGLTRALPTAEDWMSMVGLGLDDGFANVFPDLTAEQRALVQERCVEEEHFALERGEAALLPGAREMLEELRAAGVRMGIASNCPQYYLDNAMGRMGLGELVEEGRCLDSPGVRDKADMVRDLLWTFGTRSAVMVGDRGGDRDAAHANGLPHVHLSCGYAPRGEEVRCEATIDDLLELPGLLRGRGAWLDAALARLDLENGGGARSLGVTGRTGAGKTLFARDLVRRVTARGRAAAVVALDDFLRADAPSLGGATPAEGLAPHEHLARAFDVDELCERVLAPHARGEAVAFERARPDGSAAGVEVPAGALLVLEGLFLLHPRLRARLDRVVHLTVDEGPCLARLAARELPLGGRATVERARDTWLPTQRAFEEAFPPAERADLVLPAENPLGDPGAAAAR